MSDVDEKFAARIAEAAELFGKSQFEEAAKLTQSALDLLKGSGEEEAKQNFQDGLRMLLRCWMNAANKSRSKEQFEIAKTVGEELRERLQSSGEHNSAIMAHVLKDIATNFSNFGKASSALDAYRQAYALERSLGVRDLEHVATCRGMADAHIGLKEYPNAFHFLGEAAAILEKEKPKSADLAVVLMRQATCQFRAVDQELAIRTFERGLKLHGECGAPQDTSVFASYLWSFQGMLMENKLFQRSIEIGEQAKTILLKPGNEHPSMLKDVENRINFCRNKLDPSHPLSQQPTESDSRVLVAAGSIKCSFCGVTPKRAIDEPDRNVAPIVFKKCSQCKAVHYCSVGCQKQHWPKHKVECAKIAKK